MSTTIGSMGKVLVRSLAAISDATRFQIVNILATYPNICVSELASKIGVSNSAISQHCRILELSGLVEPKRDGHKVCYQLRTDRPVVSDLLKLINKYN